MLKDEGAVRRNDGAALLLIRTLCVFSLLLHGGTPF